MGWVQFFLAESQSRLYPHMRAKFGRDPMASSKKVTLKFIIGCTYSKHSRVYKIIIHMSSSNVRSNQIMDYSCNNRRFGTRCCTEFNVNLITW